MCVEPKNDGGQPHLLVKYFCDCSTDEERQLRESIMQVFCSELDLLPFYDKASDDAGFSEVVKRLRGLKPHLSQDPFESLVKAVVRQVVRADTARQSVCLLVLRFGIKRLIKGMEYYSFPSPQAISGASKIQLTDCNVGYKWKLIKRLSRDVASGDLDLFELARLSDEKIIERLTEYRGIGYWTSRIFLYDGLARLHAYPVCDISIRKAISLIYFHGKPISWREVELFFTDYEDFLGITATYLFGALWLRRRHSVNLDQRCS
ncbi:MAG: hypothetical protein OEY31_07740 [Candidatus Bathyarchaeota archaeon]|nr:hypothetical protein [Candidatus Bathyarchaeota archaeon]